VRWNVYCGGYTIKVLYFQKSFVILFRKIRLNYCITYIEIVGVEAPAAGPEVRT